MLRTIFTLDYEIHGNGGGNPQTLMVEPTCKMMRLFEEFGAKLTIMADVAEILKFKEYKEKFNRDDYYYDAIVEQLRSAVNRGHDVQLHIHSSYYNARYKSGKWHQDWSEYNFAGLPYNRMVWMVRSGKEFLENLLKPVKSDYRCLAFRAANWSVSPSRDVVNSLIENNIIIDTSVFKGGKRNGYVTFDYTNAYHHMRPWPASPDDICLKSEDSNLWEFPIYAEERFLINFFSFNRIYRALLGRLHRIPKKSMADSDVHTPKGNAVKGKLSMFLEKQTWKADFNQCSGRQLISALLRAEKETSEIETIPFVLIGHSKLFNSWNEKSLKPFLKFISKYNKRFDYGLFPYFTDLIN